MTAFALPAAGRAIETPADVDGVRLITFPEVLDSRGSLSAGELQRGIPFTPRRFFLIYDVPSSQVRGEHAHRACAQLLIAVRGRLTVLVDDGYRRQRFLLDRPNHAVFVPPMIWAEQSGYSSDAMLLVLASEHYDPADYIREYADYLLLVSRGRRHVQE